MERLRPKESVAQRRMARKMVRKDTYDDGNYDFKALKSHNINKEK